MHGGEVEAVATREGAELVLGGGGDGGEADEAGVGEGLGDDGREVGEVEGDVAAAEVRKKAGEAGAARRPSQKPAQLVDLLTDLAAGAAESTRGGCLGGQQRGGAGQAGAIEGIAGADAEREGVERGVIGEGDEDARGVRRR